MSGVDVVLADGSTVHVRPMSPTDADGVVAMHARFSDRTRYLRYFSPYPRIPARDLDRFVNVDHGDREALVAQRGDDLIGVARYERLGAGADEAEVAFVVADEFQGRGLGSVLLEHLAALAAQRGIARFVAEILPANGRMQRVFADAGYEVTREYADGVVHLTFPTAATARSRSVQEHRERRADAASVRRLLHATTITWYGRAQPQPADVSQPELALIDGPAAGVPAALTQAAADGAGSAVVLTRGIDDDGRAALVRLARQHGIRLIGPGSLGVVNTATGLNATGLADLPPPGRVGMLAQSAVLSEAMLAGARRRGLGLSTFISTGDRGDVSGNDLLQYWHDDPGTDAVLLYLESFGNPRKFARLARGLARRKPVVLLAAITPRGFGASGVIRVDTLAELFDVAELVTGPLPGGTGLGVVCAVAAYATIAAGVAPAAGLRLAAVRRSDDPAKGVADLLADERVDAVLVAGFPAGWAGDGPEKPDKPIIEVTDSIEESIRALGRLAAFAAWRREPVGEYPHLPGINRAAALTVASGAWTGVVPGPDPRPAALLAAYGIEVLPGQRQSGGPKAVAAAADALGYPVVLKVASAPWRHRVDLGAVRLGLADAAEVIRAHEELWEHFGAYLDVVVQRMAPPGVACVVHAADDPGFGPVVGFGLGGVATELLDDVAWMPAPLTDRDAGRLLAAPRAAPLLRGHRGTPPVDLAALADLVLRVGRLAADLPSLAELSLNPVLAHPTGLSVVSAELRVAPAAHRPDTGPRQLA